jgi:homoserine acetyltransferase
MPNAQYKVLESDFGHDGFLIQSSELAGMIREFRAGLRTRAAA